MDTVLYFDGSSLDKGRRGGPGHSAGAAVLFGADGSRVTRSVFIRSGDSLAAEYSGLILGLRLAGESGIKRLLIQGDSRIVIDHVKGNKVMKNPAMAHLRSEALHLLEGFESWNLEWIPRRKNLLADEAARFCLERAVAEETPPPVLNQ